MADPVVREAQGVFIATVGSTNVKPGDACYFDGTDWELADADDNTKYAEAFATADFVSLEQGTFCLECIIVDTDAPYTQGASLYLSETAGAITETRPVTAFSLRQVLAFALSTSELHAKVTMPREHHEVVNMSSITPVITTFDGGNFYGVLSNADAEVITAAFVVPQNCVGLVYAGWWAGAEAVTGATDLTILASGAGSDEQWDANTVDSSLTTMVITGGADDVFRGVLTTGLDATNIIRPDTVVGIKAVHDGAQTDAIAHLVVEVTYLVV